MRFYSELTRIGISNSKKNCVILPPYQSKRRMSLQYCWICGWRTVLNGQGDCKKDNITDIEHLMMKMVTCHHGLQHNYVYLPTISSF